MCHRWPCFIKNKIKQSGIYSGNTLFQDNRKIKRGRTENIKISVLADNGKLFNADFPVVVKVKNFYEFPLLFFRFSFMCMYFPLPHINVLWRSFAVKQIFTAKTMSLNTAFIALFEPVFTASVDKSSNSKRPIES